MIRYVLYDKDGLIRGEAACQIPNVESSVSGNWIKLQSGQWAYKVADTRVPSLNSGVTGFGLAFQAGDSLVKEG